MFKSLFSLFLLSITTWLIQPSHLSAGPNGPGGPTELECEDSRDQSGPFQVYTGAESACVLNEEKFKKDVLKASKCDANENGKIDESEVDCVVRWLKGQINPQKDREKGATKKEVWKWLEPFLDARDYWFPGRYLEEIMKYDCNGDGFLSEEEVKDMLRGKKCRDN